MFWFYTDIIAFDAELKSPLKGIRSGQKIIFPVIRENIGGGYDAGNGVFTAPLSGVYVFQWTTVVTELVSTETVLVVDGKRRALNKCNSNKANNDSCTKITIVKLAPEKGFGSNVSSAIPPLTTMKARLLLALDFEMQHI